MRENFPEEKVIPDRLVRLNDILEIIPVSPATWWAGVRCGKFPKGIKLGSKTTCWRLSEIMDLAQRGTGEGRFKNPGR